MDINLLASHERQGPTVVSDYLARRAQLLQILPGRFRGLVQIDGRVQACYLPLSSRLGVVIPPEGVPCWVLPKSGGTQSYSLFSFKLEDRWFLLDPKELQARTLAFLQDDAPADYVAESLVVPGYRADFVSSPDKSTVIEMKSVLVPTEEPVDYPSTQTLRFERQLTSLLELRRRGQTVKLLFLCLGRKPSQLRLATRQPKLLALLQEARNQGVVFEILTVEGEDLAFRWSKVSTELLELLP